jgi:putative Mg2+ transporter-C (MgtC) family protein
VGSTLIMLVSLFGFGDVLGEAHVVLDPSRVAAQVVSGIGFLGAGAILFRQDKIRGLTTAASLWTVAAVGLAVGGGLYVPAVGGTAIVFAILAGLKPLERRYWSARGGSEIVLTVEREIASLAMLESVLTTAGVAIRTVAIQSGNSADEDEIVIGVHRPAPEAVMALIDRLKESRGVRTAAIRN